MLFLLTAFALESNCKSTNNNPTGKNYFHHIAENVQIPLMDLFVKQSPEDKIFLV